MTVSDILKYVVCKVQITKEEDPNDDKPDVIIDALDPVSYLSNEVLDSEIHLVSVVNDNICISIF